MGYNIGPTIAVNGEADFKAAMNNIKNEMKYVKAAASEATSTFSKQDNSVEALTARQKGLKDALEVQRKAVEASEKALTEMKEKGVDENSKAFKDMEANVANAKSAFNKTQVEIKQTEESIEGLNNAAQSESIGKFGNALKVAGKAAAVAAAAIAAAAVAAAAAIGKMVVSAGEAADEINTLSTQTGLSVESIQKFQYAAETIDVSMDDLMRGLAKTTKSIGEAVSANQDYIEIASGVKVAIKNTNGELLSSEDIFYASIDALSKMTNETERDIAAQEMFGKSYQTLLPLIEGGSEALKNLGEEAEKAGLILSQEALDKINTVQDAIDRFKSTAKLAGNLFSTAFAEPIANAINFVVDQVHILTAAFNTGGFDAFSQKIGEVIGNIVTYITDSFPKIISFAMNIVTKIMETIINNLPIIIQAGAETIISFVKAISDTLPTLLPQIAEAIIGIIITISQNIPFFIEAGINLIRGLVDGLIAAIPIIVEALPNIIIGIVDTLLNSVPIIIQAGIDLMTSLVSNLPSIIEGIVEAIPKIITGIIDSLMNNIPLIIDAGIKLLVSLIQNLPQIIITIVAAIPQIIASIVSGVLSGVGQLAAAGGELIRGLWQGISDKGAWIWEKVKGFFTNLTDKIKNFFGIHSPSKLFADMGEMLPPGLAEGVRDAMPKAIEDIKTAFAGVSVEVPKTLNTFGASSLTLPQGMQGSQNTVNIYPQELTEAQVDYLFTKFNARLAL